MKTPDATSMDKKIVMKEIIAKVGRERAIDMDVCLTCKARRSDLPTGNLLTRQICESCLDRIPVGTIRRPATRLTIDRKGARTNQRPNIQLNAFTR